MELYSDDIKESTKSNVSAEEWKTLLRGLTADKTIVIKGAKGSSVVVWDRSDYLHESSRQLKIRSYMKMLYSMKTHSLILLQKAIRYLNICVVIN